MRFRKRIKIAPGININLSKGGVSTSIGKPGATVNIGGKNGTKATVGIPGSGLSYSEQLSKPARKKTKPQNRTGAEGLSLLGVIGYGVLALFIFLLIVGLFAN